MILVNSRFKGAKMEERTSPTTDPMAELTAMTEVAKALQPLDSEAVRRVIAWAADRFGASAALSAVPNPAREPAETDSEEYEISEAIPASFSDVADLYSRTEPRNDAERALIVAYWFQKLGGEPDFDSAKINRELKHLGHGVSNITAALSSLIAKKPQLVIQTRKSGSSQQARKRYKLTTEGLKHVERMLRDED
jgi:cytochrome c556